MLTNKITKKKKNFSFFTYLLELHSENMDEKKKQQNKSYVLFKTYFFL